MKSHVQSFLMAMDLGANKRLLRVIIFVTIVAIYMFATSFPTFPKVPHKQVAGWEMNVTRDTRVYAAPHNDTTLINANEMCSDSSVILMVVVCSAPQNSVFRQAIRETWASHNSTGLKVVFLLGSTTNISLQNAIELESKHHRDIIQENFVDSYNNLTVKSVRMLKWFLYHCPSPRFLMKTDDDTYVNVITLSSVVSKLRARAVLIGYLICRARPILDSRHKWFTPRYMFKEMVFPNYLSGSAYLMSRDVAYRLYMAALTTPLLYLEDVYITGVCARKAGLRPRNYPGFHPYFSPKCFPNQITNHYTRPDMFQISWAERSNCSSLTTRPTKRPARTNVCH